MYKIKLRHHSCLVAGILTSAFGPQMVHAEGKIVVNESVNARIGDGYHLNQQKFRGECVKGVEKYEGKPISTAYSLTSVAQESLSKQLGLEAGGRARIGVIEASASASFLNNSKSDKFSISFVYTGDYGFKDRFLTQPKLTDLGASLVKNPKRWEETCGDEYVFRQELGAKVFISIRFDFKSEEEKKNFAANFNVSGPLFSASGRINHDMSSFSKDTRVTVNLLQVGGNVDKLTDVFHDAHRRAGAESSSAMDFVQCTLGDFNKCAGVLARALDYATNSQTGFPSQINPSGHSDVQSGGPALLAVYTQKYSVAGIYWGSTPEMDKANETARKRIGDLFEDNYNKYITATRLVRQPLVRLSEKQAEAMEEIERTLMVNLRKIGDASMRCFDNSSLCVEAQHDLEESADLSRKIVPVDSKVFDIQPETFAQYCDLANSLKSNKALRSTVDSLIYLAESISPQSFVLASGAEVDRCMVTQKVLMSQRNLDLSSREIEREGAQGKVKVTLTFPDLNPVSTFTQLRSLNLKNNQIRKVSPLKNLKQLRSLDLSQNQIRKVGPLKNLIELETLYLQDNRLEDVSSLSALSGKLKLLDLRNNGSAIQCPLPDVKRCVLEDYRSGYSFVEYGESGLGNLVQGHVAFTLPNNDVFVQGSCKPDSCEMFGPGVDPVFGSARLLNVEQDKNKYVKLEYNSESRYLALIDSGGAVLPNGQVILVGGKCQVFDSQFRSQTLQDGVIWSYQPDSGKLINISKEIKSIGNRVEHSVNFIGNSRVLIAGGYLSSANTVTRKATVFNAEDRSIQEIQALNQPRASHATLALSENKVLITGGRSGGRVHDSAEIFEVRSGVSQFRQIQSHMEQKRYGHQMTVLKNGKVLITGSTRVAEIYDPITEQFKALPQKLNEARAFHTSSLLENGKVLLAGGYSVNEDGVVLTDKRLSTSEIFDPDTERFSLIGEKMMAPRAKHTAHVLPHGRVLLIGGVEDQNLPVTELFSYPTR